MGPPGWMRLGRVPERLLLLELGWTDRANAEGDLIDD
jgi:hypothetical protein